MDEETKDMIVGFVWLGIMAGGLVGATYLSYKVLATMTGKVVVKELIKHGAVLTAAAL